MPTPESEAFKAKKPSVPPTFAGVDFTNNQQVWDARDAIIREQWVKQMMARLVREELGMSNILIAQLLCRKVILVEAMSPIWWAAYNWHNEKVEYGSRTK